MTPLERAARALYEKRANHINEGIRSGSLEREPWPEWSDISSTAQYVLHLEARAVIEAIREPSEGMETDGAMAGDWNRDIEIGDEAVKVWQAMIDAAVSEGGVG